MMMDTATANWEEYAFLAKELTDRGQFEEAVTNYEKAIELGCDKPWVYIKLGEIYSDQGNYHLALATVEKAIELDDQNIWGYVAAAKVLQREGKFEEALEKCEAGLQVSPRNPTLEPLKVEIIESSSKETADTWLKYAISARDKAEVGENEEAVQLYNQAICLNPNEAWPYIKLAQLVGRREQLNLYKKVVEIEPDNPWGHVGIAGLLKEDNKEELEDATEKCEDGLRIHPDDGDLQKFRQVISIKEDLPSRRLITEVAKTLFDNDFYKQQYASEQYIQSLTNEEAFQHFLNQVTTAGQPLAAPNVWFFPEIYRDIHNKEPFDEWNPFLHYLAHGYVQGLPPLHGIANIAVELIRKRIEQLFDVDFYLSKSPDLDPEKVDLIDHFMLYGWKEGRSPASWFDVLAYQRKFPLVKDLNINPLYFYACLHPGDSRRWVDRKVGKQESKFRKAIKITPQRETRRDPKSAVEYQALLRQAGYLEPERYSQSLSKARPDRLRIHFVIPEFSKGGGGHMTIFRIVRWLEFFGHECTVWVQDPNLAVHPTGWRDDVYRYFQQVKASFRPLNSHFWYTTGDVLVATAWETVEAVMAHDSFNDRFYLVQDYEPYFFARGSTALQAEDTYRQDIACICASSWLKKLMEEKFGRWARHFNLAYESDIYRVYDDRGSGTEWQDEEVCNLVVYSRKHTARRAVELCLEALNELATRRGDFVVHFFGDSEVITDISYQAFHHGIMDKHELADLYNDGTIGITFSATNYSLVPQEMMACGLPIVEIDNESTVSIFPPDVVSMARPNPKAIANEIEALMDNPRRREHQRQAALEWISELSWESSIRAVEQAFLDHLWEIGRLEEPEKTVSQIQVSEKHQYHAAVMIPTFNGGQLIKEVLDRVQQQHTPWPFQIVIVDSSSTDGTQEYLRQQQDIVFHTIPQSEFQHGATRNLGVQLSDAEYIAFLTQDAFPAGNYWLYDLVSCLEAHPAAAGVFGRHVAYEEATEFTKRDLLQHFEGFDQFPVELSLQTNFEKLRQGDLGWQQVLHYYSDNNSCLRRNVWERYPYPEVYYGEDQMWADVIIKAGYSKVYSKAALVYHSHDYNYQETFKRAKTEAEFFLSCFGYKMVNSRKQMESDIAAINKRDIAYGNQKGLSMNTIFHQLNLNRAKFEGWAFKCR
jgi:tetratricopeptide (TPR) repeat protein/glycosyltransferase involved in cell wall biosynthesis